jgi:uncharacterized membrane protein
MTSEAIGSAAGRKPLSADQYEKGLSLGAILLLSAVAIALIKGRATWANVPTNVWVHLGLIIIALMLTPVMLLRKRGDRFHRGLGWIWASAMLFTALASFDIRLINRGGFSFIHLLSAWTVVQVPIIILSARAHNIARHRRAVRGMVTGALLIAGFFTFPFNRLMGQWLFG